MDLFKTLLIIHIVCGATSFVVGMVVLFLKKGDSRHRKFGSLFFYTLLISSLISFPMAYLHENLFLFIVGIFTAYMLLSGKRSISMKSSTDVKPVDYILTTLMFLFGILFVFLGIKKLLSSDTFGFVLIVFGLISAFFIFKDLQNFRSKTSNKKTFLAIHIARMVGGYIAAITAFLVVNNTFLPNIVAWLLPTFILVPLIIKWIRKYAPIK